MTHSCLGRYNAAGCKTLVTSNLLIHVSQYKLSSCFFVFFLKSFMPAHEFPLLIFLTEHNFSAAQSHMYWYIYTKWIFSTIKRRNRKLGGLGGEVFTRFTPKTRVCVIYVRGFCISTWSFQVKILKLIKHRHNATFSVEKRRFWRLGYV